MKRRKPITCARCGRKVGFVEMRDTDNGTITHWFLTASATSNSAETVWTCRKCPDTPTASMKARSVNSNEATGGVL